MGAEVEDEVREGVPWDRAPPRVRHTAGPIRGMPGVDVEVCREIAPVACGSNACDDTSCKDALLKRG